MNYCQTEIDKALAIMEKRLEVAEAGKTAAEEQLADISVIVPTETSQESNVNREKADTTDQQLDFAPIKKRVEVSNKLETGQWVNGEVKNITDFGAFVDLDGNDGLIHKSELSHNHINHPSDIVTLNQIIKVKVININQENGQISLRFKRDPWEENNVEKQYKIDSIVNGTVSRTADYGVFVELEEGLIGMIHKSQLSWKQNDILPSDFNQGEKIKVVILDISKIDKHISLGIKQLKPNPWKLLKENLPIGTEVKGPVVNITDFGVFIEVEPSN